MIQVLSVAEKPSVAKELANIIGRGGGSSRNGMSRFNRLYDVGECEIGGGVGRCDMTITSVLGHVMDIEFTDANKSWQGSAQKLEELFDAPIRKSVKAESNDLVRTIQTEARRCSVLMLWLDGDLEGENISYEVLGLCQEVNPNIRVLRARFSALIPRDIFRTLRNPDSLNPNMNDAICARQEIDLRIGAAFTRFLTLRCQNRYEELANKGVISYGPCQFPTLGFVVDRYFKVQNFVPEQFWSLHCDARRKSKTQQQQQSGPSDTKIGTNTDSVDNNLAVDATSTAPASFHWQRGNVFDRYCVTVLYDLCMLNLAHARVVDVSGSASRRHRPVPLNTVALQMKASSWCRMSSAETMEVAEKLYQKGVLSYPRTETDYFKEGTDLMSLIGEHQGHSLWGGFARKLMEPAQPPQEPFFLWPKPGGHDDEAHPPIHPTKCVELNTLDDREKALYELVVRHFLACCSRDAEGGTTTVKVVIPTVAGGAVPVPLSEGEGHPLKPLSASASGFNCNSPLCGEIFSTSGTVIRELNYLEVYKYEKWHGSKIPDFTVGELVQITRLEMTGGKTCAPLPLSESDLISEMDRNKIGTDATIATHIATIIAREYVSVDNSGGGNRLIPTPLGTALCEAFNRMGYQLNKPTFRAQMERDCTRIARGELQKEQMLRECLETMKMVLRSCMKEVRLLDAAMARHFHPLGAGIGGPSHGAGAGGLGAGGTPFTVLSAEFGQCGRCRHALQLRQTAVTEADGPRPGQRATSSTLRYLYCGTCALSLSLPRSGDFRLMTNTSTRAPVLCPICQFQVISVTPVENNNNNHNGNNASAAGSGGGGGVGGGEKRKKGSHNICSYCFSTPPEPPDAEEGTISEFRCFTCANTQCELAGRATLVQDGIVTCNLAANGSRCPDGLIQLRRGDKSFSIGCSKYPNCGNKFASKWLPRAVKSAVPIPAEICAKCSPLVQFPVVKLRLEINTANVPMHMRGDPTRLVCLCCSSFWSDMDETPPLVNLTASRGSVSVSVSGGGNSYSNLNGTDQLQVQKQPPVTTMGFLNGYHTMRENATAVGAEVRRGLKTKAGAAGRGMPVHVDYGSAGSGSGSGVIRLNNDYAAAAVGLTTAATNRDRGRGGRGNANGGRGSGGGYSYSGDGGGGAGGGSSSNSNNPPCGCGIPCAQFTVSKEGPNKGRRFNTCGNNKTCKFFEWVDIND